MHCIYSDKVWCTFGKVSYPFSFFLWWDFFSKLNFGSEENNCFFGQKKKYFFEWKKTFFNSFFDEEKYYFLTKKNCFFPDQKTFFWKKNEKIFFGPKIHRRDRTIKKIVNEKKNFFFEPKFNLPKKLHYKKKPKWLRDLITFDWLLFSLVHSQKISTFGIRR